jgi:hypothetical protein
MGKNSPGKGRYRCRGRSAPKCTVPKGPSAEEKFRTEVVVMLEDCFQVMVRLRCEEKQILTLAGIIEKELIGFGSK